LTINGELFFGAAASLGFVMDMTSGQFGQKFLLVQPAKLAPVSVDLSPDRLLPRRAHPAPLPRTGHFAPCTNYSAPVQNDSAPCTRRFAPAQSDSAPRTRHSAPVQNDSAPCTRHSAPAQNDFAPRTERPFPGKNQSVVQGQDTDSLTPPTTTTQLTVAK
jgi:hypothetical protein